MSRRRVLAALVACALILITVIAVKLVQGDRGPGAAGPEDPGADQATVEGRTERISVPIDGTKLKGPFTQTGSRGPAISADGRYVAYVSPASNLVPGDTNKRLDVFVRDRKTQSTTRVTVPSDGTQANGDSTYPSMSADARYVAYSSNASNLVPGDTNDYRDDEDLFVWDRDTRTTTRISVASDGTRANGGSWMSSISADGRYIAYESDASNLVRGDTNKKRDVFVWDRDTGTTTRVSVSSDGTQANDESGYPSISADGRYVTYSSRAWNLVPGDSDTVEDRDVFVWDREAQTTTRISVTPDGTSADHDSWHSSISADGRYIVYDSYASDLAPGETRHKKNVYLWDRSVSEIGNQGPVLKLHIPCWFDEPIRQGD